MCYLIEGKATHIPEINSKAFWNNYWWLPMSLSGDSWLVVVEVAVFIISPSIFPSLLSPHVHSDIFHLSLFPLTPLMSFWVRRLLSHAPKSLKQGCSDQKPWHHLQAAGNAESHQPLSSSSQSPARLGGTLTWGKHCSAVHVCSRSHTELFLCSLTDQTKLLWAEGQLILLLTPLGSLFLTLVFILF